MQEATGNRYPGSRPFQDEAVDRIIFRGREKEKARLLQLILAEKLVVLYAKSGMGKTSLLNAGVFQSLRLKGYFPFGLRLNDPEKAPTELIYEEIEGAAEMHGLEFEGGNKDTLWQYFKTTEFWSKKDVLYTPVLVFDQFEEIFTLGFSEKQKKEFFIQLADLVRGTMPKSLKRRPQISKESPYSDKPPNIKIVISIREDFLGDLEELANDIPTILRNRFRLTPLTQEQAKRAIEEPADLKNKQLQSRRFSYTKRALNTMIKFLSERRKGKEIVRADEIELFQLQVLCQHIEKKVINKKLATTKKILKKQRKRSKIFNLLFQYTQKKVLLLEQKTENKNLQMLCRNIEKWIAHKMQKPSSKIRIAPEDFGGLSGMQKIWRNFYDRQIKQFTLGKRRAVRNLCQKGLISSTGRRLSLEAEMIKEKFKVTTDILSRLIANRLLRVEPRLNGFYYELSHDNLVSPIKRSSRNRKIIEGFTLALVIAVIAFVPSFIALQHAADLETADNAIQLGDTFKSGGLLDAAIVEFKKAYKLNPHDSTAVRLACAYIRNYEIKHEQNFADIFDSLSVKIKCKVEASESGDIPDDLIRTIAANQFKNLGKEKLDKEYYEIANNHYVKAFELNTKKDSSMYHAFKELAKFYFKDDSLQAYTNWGYAYRSQGKDDSATVNFQKAIEGYKARAQEYRENKKFSQAIETYTHAINLPVADSKKARLYNSRGRAYGNAGDSEKAKKDYRSAINLDPTFSAPLYNLSRVFVALSDSLREARRLARLSVGKAPQNKRYQRSLNEIQGKLELATKN